MSCSVGNSRFSQPEICSGDHCSASFCATRQRSSLWSARRQGLGRNDRWQALLSASVARYRLLVRLTALVVVWPILAAENEFLSGRVDRGAFDTLERK